MKSGENGPMNMMQIDMFMWCDKADDRCVHETCHCRACKGKMDMACRSHCHYDDMQCFVWSQKEEW